MNGRGWVARTPCPVHMAGGPASTEASVLLILPIYRAAGAVWWRKRLRPILEESGIDPGQCFFSNALMGLKEGERCGDMPFDPGYRADCQKFLLLQLDQVNPRSVIHCGIPCCE